jgi:LysR family transcriptional regulator, glycine cleavage system transcriptional activator
MVSDELGTGELVKVFDIALPGFGFYIVHKTDHPRSRAINAFVMWARSFG